MGALGNELSGGGTYLKFSKDTIGTTYSGTITDVSVRQARKFQSTELDTWDDGKPKNEAVFTLATDQRDADNPDDNGERILTIKLWGKQRDALRAAVQEAGISEPEPGMTFSATHVAGVGGSVDPRVYKYVIGKGAPVAAALAEAPTAQAAANPAETARTLLAAGLDIKKVAESTGLPETTVAALANALAS